MEKGLEDDLKAWMSNIAFRRFPYFCLAVAHHEYFLKMIVSIQSGTHYRAGRAIMVLTWWETGMKNGKTQQKAIDNIGPSCETVEQDPDHKPTTVEQVLSTIIEKITSSGGNTTSSPVIDLEQEEELATDISSTNNSAQTTPTSTRKIMQTSLKSWSDATEHLPWKEKPIKNFQGFDEEFDREAESLRIKTGAVNEEDHDGPIVVEDDESIVELSEQEGHGSAMEIDQEIINPTVNSIGSSKDHPMVLDDEDDNTGSSNDHPITIDDDDYNHNHNNDDQEFQRNVAAVTDFLTASYHQCSASENLDLTSDSLNPTMYSFFEDELMPSDYRSRLRDEDMIVDRF